MRLLRWFGLLVPVVYIWSLPLLRLVGFAHECEDFPSCRSTGTSVSDYISNTQATGAMAACFFFPTMHLWTNIQHVRHHRCVLPTLFIFQVCFGIFLASPVTEVPDIHSVAVSTFCVSALTHYGMVLRYAAYESHRWCKVLLCVAILAFIMVFILTCISSIDKTLLPRHCPYIFYCSEATGLSSMAVFPTLWIRRRSEAGVQLSNSMLIQAQGLPQEQWRCFSPPLTARASLPPRPASW